MVALVTTFVASCIISDPVFTPLQLLWVNLFIDILASVALANSSPDHRTLQTPPIRKEESTVTRKMWKHIVGQSLYQCSVLLVLILAGAYFIPEDPSSLPHNP